MPRCGLRLQTVRVACSGIVLLKRCATRYGDSRAITALEVVRHVVSEGEERLCPLNLPIKTTVTGHEYSRSVAVEQIAARAFGEYELCPYRRPIWPAHAAAPA